jgi:hypothetical protein
VSEKIIERIAKLLAQADHVNTNDEEREAFLAKADEMMAKHMIDEALVRLAQAPSERAKPVRVDVELFDRWSVFGVKMSLIASEICRTVGVRMATRSGSNVVTLVGFDDDVRWMQMLFLNTQMTFLRRLQPKWDQSLTTGANVGLFRESGMKWPQVTRIAATAGAIAEVPNEDHDYNGYWKSVNSVKATYKKHCKETGQQPVSVTRHEAYRHTYAEAFTNRICARLADMRASRQAAGSGSELVLARVMDDVNDAFYQEFPDISPEARAQRYEAQKKAEEQRDLEHAAWLAGLTPAARLRHEREQVAQRQREARNSDKYWAEQDRKAEKRYDSTGARVGRKAADSVNLSTSESVNHQDVKGLS